MRSTGFGRACLAGAVILALGAAQPAHAATQRDGVQRDVVQVDVEDVFADGLLRLTVTGTEGPDIIRTSGAKGLITIDADRPLELQASASLCTTVRNDPTLAVCVADIVAVLARGGADRVSTATAADVLFGADGGDGDDEIDGGPGGDTVIGGAGNDTLHGGTGGDTVLGGRGDDQLADLRFTEQAHDTSVDTLDGQEGADSCWQGPQDHIRNCEQGA